MFSKKNLIALGALSVVALVFVIFIATNLIIGHRKKVEDGRIALVVGDATLELRKALAAGPATASVAKLDELAQSVKASPNPAAGSAAEAYLLGARGIARQRAESERLSREAAAARNALAGHMARAERRSTTWFHGATELKRRVEASHADLARSLKTLDDLLYGLPDAEKRLAPHVAAAALLEQREIDAARARAQDESQRAASELEKVRRITP
jgi:type IV secretory pathway TrbL component